MCAVMHGNCVYCRTGYILPCFNFAHFAILKLDEFKTRANIHSIIEYIVYIETRRIKTGQNRNFPQEVEIKIEATGNILCFTVPSGLVVGSVKHDTFTSSE